MSPQDFIAKWGAPDGVPGPAFALNEEQGAQSHFLDLCELLDVPKPGSAEDYLFEEKGAVIGGRTGYADVFMRGVFAWENKAPGKNLDAALKQLLSYSLALSNPPLLVVSDRLTMRIHTQFTGHPSEVHEVKLEELDQPEKLALLRRIWLTPESFKPKLTNRDITEAAAKNFANLAEGLRRRGEKLGSDRDFAQRNSGSDPNFSQLHANLVAHFLTQCLFCFFAEDVGLLPGRMFERLVTNRKITADKLTQGLSDLFDAMGSGGMFGADEIPWFNGGLFKTVAVPALSILDVTELRKAAELNWSAIDVSIFGTLFERGLDPAKRSQLGAHYTDTATIDRLVEPVLRRPLLQRWQQVAQDIGALQARSTKKGDKNYRDAKARFIQWLDELKNYRVLDPACGSGNFLFLGLKALKDIEHRSHLDAAALGLDREADLVTGPHNVLGIELNEYAAELARVTVWIGELQWRLAHGYEFKTNPVLEPLDHIECRDALLTVPVIADPSSVIASEARQSMSPVSEATWPKANVVIGNPPFLGGSKKRRELGDTYFAALDSVFSGRVPGGADLVCYWFDKARVQIQSGQLQAAGLVATQAIRAGSNRVVLERLLQTPIPNHNLTHDQPPPRRQHGPTIGLASHRSGDLEVDDRSSSGVRDVAGDQSLFLNNTPLSIFSAWADEPWVNEGAAVRVSLVCFGTDSQTATLNGQAVARIHADLTGGDGLDLTMAVPLAGNVNASFEGTKKYGDFDIPGRLARQWLTLPNPHGQSNAMVVKPWCNGQDLNKRPSDTWIIDFGVDMDESSAALFETPFIHVLNEVKPARLKAKISDNWWLHERARAYMRKALQGLPRYIATTRVSKHRHFSWLHSKALPDSRLNVITRADDTTFGILSSRIHEVWSLAQASMHGVGNDPTYNAKSCFETFPFPVGLTPADTAHQQTEEVEGGALIPVIASEARQSMQSGVMDRHGLRPRDDASVLAADSQSEPAPPSEHQQTTKTRDNAIAIAKAAKKLNDLREAWLNPKEWTHKVPEVTPLGMSESPYPDRIEPKPGISQEDLKALQKRTLTNLYNLRPQWLVMAHQQLDLAVAQTYGWSDYSADLPDEEILKRLLALNLARQATQVLSEARPVGG